MVFLNDILIGYSMVARTIGASYRNNTLLRSLTYILQLTYVAPIWGGSIPHENYIHKIDLILKYRERVMCYIIEEYVEDDKSKVSYLFKYSKYASESFQSFLGVKTNVIYDVKTCLCGKHNKKAKCVIL